MARKITIHVQGQLAAGSTTSSNLESTAETTPIPSLSINNPSRGQLQATSPGTRVRPQIPTAKPIPGETPRFLHHHPRKASKDGRVKWKKLASIPTQDIPLWFDKLITIWITSDFPSRYTCQQHSQ
ncbi:hypothetical protein FRC03_007856 [Tulasnella sp. 419]|nr:hypothetical protein FRC03_007856 [Tulasnella sp. 419]